MNIYEAIRKGLVTGAIPYSELSTKFVTTNYVTMGDVLNLDRDRPFSFSFWVKATGTVGAVLGKQMRSGNYNGYAIGLMAGGYMRLELINTLARICSARSIAVNDGVWHHITFTYDGTGAATGIRAYVDGAANSAVVVSNTLGAYSIASTYDFQLGWSNTDMMIDEITVWDKELTITESEELYNLGRPGDVSEVSFYASKLAWWRMGDGDTYPIIGDASSPYRIPHVQDASGNGLHGTMVKMTAVSVKQAAPYGKCLVFGGTNERVTMGDVLGFERTDPFSITLWFRTASIANMMLAGKFLATATAYPGYNLRTDSTGALVFELVSNVGTGNYLGVITTSTWWLRDEWNHVAFTYDGSSTAAGCNIYVNGVLQTLTPTIDALSGSILSAAKFQLGMRDGASSPLPYTGYMQNVAVWDKELSGSEVLEVYGGAVLPHDLAATSMSANLVAWWKACGVGDANPTIADSGPHGYTGTMVNMEATDVTDRLVDVNVADLKASMLFDASDDFVNMGNVLDLTGAVPFSWSFWFNTTGAGNKAIIAKSVNAVTGQGYLVHVDSLHRLQLYLINTYPGNQYILVTTTAGGLSDGLWHHGVVTYDGSGTAAGVKMYIDAQSEALTVGKDTFAGTMSNTGNFNLGRQPSDGLLPWRGLLDEISIWDAVLSPAQVLAIYNDGFPSDLTGSTGLVAYWHMGDDLGISGDMTSMSAASFVADVP